MRRYIHLVTAMLVAELLLTACKHVSSEQDQGFAPLSSTVLADVKMKTRLELPRIGKLLVSTNDSSRLNAELWLVQFDKTNQVQFPAQSQVMNSVSCHNSAMEMERISGMSLGNPLRCSFTVWQVNEAQCHATLVTTSNSTCLMLERFY